MRVICEGRWYYKVLGGSFTGTLSVDPSHMRDLKLALGPAPIAPPDPESPRDPESAGGEAAAAPPSDQVGAQADAPAASAGGSDRARRIRDAVEAALSDVVLFGTEAQVTLAATAMRDMVAGRPVHLHDLVAELRAHIRQTLDLAPIPANVRIPNQGPARPSSSGNRGGRDGGGSRGGGGGMGGGMGGGGMGMGSAAGDEAGTTRG